MSNEIKMTLKIDVLNGEYTRSVNPGLTQIDQNTLGAAGGILEISTGGEAIDFTAMDLVKEGILYLKNLDDTNYVTFVVYGKMKPGEFAALRLNPSTQIGSGTDVLTVTADTAPVKLEYLCLDN
jgi:hypothetical protein